MLIFRWYFLFYRWIQLNEYPVNNDIVFINPYDIKGCSMGIFAFFLLSEFILQVFAC